MNDLKFAVRQSLKNPGFTAVALLSAVAGAACFILAFRATRADPAVVLRAE